MTSPIVILNIILISISGCKSHRDDDTGVSLPEKRRFEESCKIMEQRAIRLWNKVEQSSLETAIKSYLDEFGKGSLRDDYEWAFAAPDIILPIQMKGPVTVTNDEGDKSIQDWQLLWYHSQLMTANWEVDRFLRDGQELDRFYRIMLWGHQLFGRPTVHSAQFNFRLKNCVEGIAKFNGDEQRIWYFRDFILMAHATDRDDLLKGASVVDLPERFESWKKWLLEGDDPAMRHLIADPDRPVWKYDASVDNSGALPAINEGSAPLPKWDGDIPTRIGKLALYYLQNVNIKEAMSRAAHSSLLGKSTGKDRSRGTSKVSGCAGKAGEVQ